jgi:hypothetical protein
VSREVRPHSVTSRARPTLWVKKKPATMGGGPAALSAVIGYSRADG